MKVRIWAAIAGLAIAWILGHWAPQKQTPAQAAADFQALPQPERNVAVFDAFVELLSENYYDPKLLKTAEWRARLDEYRVKAAAPPATSCCTRMCSSSSVMNSRTRT